MVFVVGLTGNLASGKTTCAKIFANFGIQVINADEISKQLTLQDGEAYQTIVAHFGSKIINNTGEINRKVLRELIFENPKERIWLENLLHPLIRKAIEVAVVACQTAYCLVEIPLLLSKKDYPYLNEILLIIAPENLQIERVIARDHCSKEQALSILAAQPSSEDRMKIADRIIINDNNLEHLQLELKLLHKEYLKKANSIKDSQSSQALSRLD